MKQEPRCVLIGKRVVERGAVKITIKADAAWAKRKKAK